jgi:hypothetical protein
MSFTYQDSRRLRSASFTSQFMIGAEFELYIKRDKPKPALLAGQRVSLQEARRRARRYALYLFTEAKDDVLALLAKRSPGVAWAKKLTFDTDASLNCRAAEPGVEIVLRHCPGPEALHAIGEIFRVLGAEKRVRVDQRCGFHLNVSFRNKELNTIQALAQVHEHVDIASLRELFGRSNNDYCVDNNMARVGLGDDFGDYEVFELMAKAANKSRLDTYNARYGEIASLVKELSNPKALAAFQAALLASARISLLESWADERPACAPRLANIRKDTPRSLKANYMEFRMMGGKTYLSRPLDVAGSIQKCLEAMVLSSKRGNKKSR